ncbi:hypothetical protein, partial [Pseudomonas aeruginosa]|uniref:hypothetical protein n=1 Tax=Pseudomonas aeruginosa TaxID=287 RepID=UPI003979D65B
SISLRASADSMFVAIGAGRGAYYLTALPRRASSFHSRACLRVKPLFTAGSAIDLAKHDVLRTDDRDGIGNHVT